MPGPHVRVSATESFPSATDAGDYGTFVNNRLGRPTEELEGLDFANHAGGTHAKSNFTITEVSFTRVSQTETGSVPAANPYQVTTILTFSDPDTNGRPILYQLTEVDAYVVGMTSTGPTSRFRISGGRSTPAQQTLYHAADCHLRGSDTGFGITEPPLGALVQRS
jgi:hypothetical protein